MKLSYLFYCMVIFGMTISSCKTDTTQSNQAADTLEQIKRSYTDISVQDALTIHQAKDGTVFLDVRTPAETNGGIIEGAQILDYRESGFEDRLKQLNKDTKYVVYCKSGGRSTKTMAMMKKLGFSNVQNLEGGYSAWSELNK